MIEAEIIITIAFSTRPFIPRYSHSEESSSLTQPWKACSLIDNFLKNTIAYVRTCVCQRRKYTDSVRNIT